MACAKEVSARESTKYFKGKIQVIQ